MPPSTCLSPTRIPSSLPPHLRFLPLPTPRAHLHFQPPPPLRLHTTALLPILPCPPLGAYARGDSIHSSRSNATPGDLPLDAVLCAAELFCLVPPAICSMVCLFRPATPLMAFTSSRLFAAQCALLVGAVAIGSLIRWRQWGRLYRVNGAAAGGVEMIGRIEKVEEGVRSLATAVAVLSRSVEKLGVRFRVSRRALKDPIMEAATLAQKNSEATRILAAQEDILEKELGEIQKVLFAMQEQQQKQLELILAIANASRILEGKQDLLEQGNGRASSPVPKIETKELKVEADIVAGGNNKP